LPLKIVFAAACDDVVGAQDEYAERSVALGRRFRRALDCAVFGIAQNPLGFRVVWQPGAHLRGSLIQTWLSAPSRCSNL
jgi:hypothetical protein